jgi:hypothetical protein
MTSTAVERIMFRMLEARSLPSWRAEPYFYSFQYTEDCEVLRSWMKENGVKQTFILYGDMCAGSGPIINMKTGEEV